MLRIAGVSSGWLSLAFVLSLTACASSGGLIASFEDLSTESERVGFFKVPQYRVMSVPGLLPFANVGDLHFYKARRKPGSAVGISSGCSYLLVSEVPANCDIECMAAIRDDLADLQTKAVKVIEARVALSDTERAGEKAPAGKLADDKSAYHDARQKFDALQLKIKTQLRKSGVIVYRWTTDDKTSGNLKLGSLFNGSYSAKRRYNGFALVSGLRTTTLFVGPDIAQRWPLLKRDSRFKNRFEVTTSITQAKHIMYVAEADLESLLDATVQASYDQLANPAQTLKQLDEIEIKAVLAKLSSLGNMGIVSAVTRQVIPTAWDQKRLEEQLQNGQSNGWLTFYTVQSDLSDLVEMATSVDEKWKGQCDAQPASGQRASS